MPTGVVRLVHNPPPEEQGAEGVPLHGTALQVAQSYWNMADMPAYCATSDDSLEEFVKFLRDRTTGTAYVVSLLIALIEDSHVSCCAGVYGPT